MNPERSARTVRATSRSAAALMVAVLPMLAVTACGESRPTVNTSADSDVAETSTTTSAADGSASTSTSTSTTAESAPSGATTSSTAVPETTGTSTPETTLATEPTTAAPTTTAGSEAAPVVIATGPSISVEELPGSSVARGAAPPEQVRLRMSGNFPMRSARLFVLIDGAVVGVGAPGATSGETIVDTAPRSAIVNGAQVSYRWESGPTTDVGALTVK